jgi:hypothetical protein
MGDGRPGSASRRVISEFAVIFVGVALALAADDFRETQAERREARESLELVVADLLADSTDFASVRSTAETHAAAAAYLTERWSDVEVSEDSIQMALGEFSDRSTLQLSSSAFEGLRNSNRLRLVANDSIRAATARYYQNRQVVIRDFYNDVTKRREALVFEALAPHVRHSEGEAAGRMWPPREPRLTLRTSWEGLTRDPRVHSEIVWFGRFSDFLGQVMSLGEADAGSLMALIRADLH